MPQWIEVIIRVPAGLEELAAESFCQPPFTGMAVETGRVTTYLSSGHATAEEQRVLEARLREQGALDVEFKAIDAPDYEQTWNAGWRAFRVGRIAIVPRAASPRLRPSDLPLRLDPGGAFGTGRHGSTRGALLLLQERITAGERVLDCGSGSGILAVAAARLGAREVLGFDIEPNAKVIGEELASENGLAERCRFLEAGFETLPSDASDYDGVLANLYLDLILRYAADIRRRVKTGGWFVVSGIRVTERERIVPHLEAHGLGVERVIRRGKWMSASGIART